MPPKKRTIPRYSVTLDLKRVGRVLKQAREILRYSLRDLAAKSQISATQLLRMESGEFEFSVIKYHAVCIALGIPVADLLEYATRREVDPLPILATEIPALEAVFASDAGWGRDESHRLYAYVANIYTVSVWILTSSNPESCAARVSPPPGVASVPSLVGFASMVKGFSNDERIATLQVLINTPYSKLKSLGLIQLNDIVKHLEKKEEWKLQILEEESIARILKSPIITIQTRG